MIANRLKQLRKQNDMTQTELAEKLNVAESTIAMYETNKRVPDAHMLIRLSKLFDCSVDYLLGLDDKNVPKGFIQIISHAQDKKIPPEKIKKLMDFLDTLD